MGNILIAGPSVLQARVATTGSSAGMRETRMSSISEHVHSAECCQATTVSSGKTNQAQGRSHNVDPFHYITLFSIFPCGLLVLFETNSRIRSTTDGGREAAAVGYRLKLTLTADSPCDSSSSTLRGQPQLSGECDKEFLRKK